jgi:aspartyl protease family protein
MQARTAIGVAAVVLAAWTIGAGATTVFVTSVGRGDVQIIVNGSAVRQLGIGQATPEGVRLLDIRNGTATFEIDRRQVSLSIGQSTASEVVIPMTRDGQFRVTAYINGRPVPAIIDTGATLVSMSAQRAASLGIQYAAGTPSLNHTANGSVASFNILLPVVQIGDMAVQNVPAAVLQSSFGKDDVVAVGNSFLRYLQMSRQGDTMVLRKANGF